MWFYLALLSAFANAIGIIARRTHGSLADPAELTWWCLVLSLPLGVIIAILDPNVLYTGTAFVLPAVASGVLCAFAAVLYFKAYKYADASAVAPISNLLPVGLVVASFVVLGVLPSLLGMLGILLIVAGVFYSSVSGKHPLSHPLKQLTHNKGSRAMLLTVVIWSVSTTFDQLALQTASAPMLIVVHQIVMFTLISCYLLVKPQKKRLKRGERVLRRWGWHILAIAIASTAAALFQAQAMTMIDNPSYVLAVKKLDVLIVIMLVFLFLKEKHIMKRFVGSLVAVVGVTLLVLST